jgi:hypothetical protein
MSFIDFLFYFIFLYLKKMFLISLIYRFLTESGQILNRF